MSRIAITGMGLHTSFGKGIAENWKEVLFPDHRPSSNDGLLQGYERTKELAFSAVQEALQQAGLGALPQRRALDAERIGCTFSASKPLFTQENAVVSPGVLTHDIQVRFELRGESRTVIAACATGAYSLALAGSWIEQNLCDVVIAGSVEPRPHPLMAAGFARLGVLSAEAVMRPFDAARSGFVFGEGAGAIILESPAHAAARGARILVWLSGWGCGEDAHSAVAFNSGGRRIADVVGKALAKARLSPSDIGHVNAHGTATRLNDALETQALHKAFGSHAARLKISATKSTTGHLLGAAGSVEFILTALALRDQQVPPTAHLTTQDAACDLDYTREHAQPLVFEHAVSLSFGFGGPIGALVASRC